MKTGKQWRTTPENTGHRRDFYRVNVAEISPEVVEQMLGSIEDRAAPVIKRVIELEVLPEGNEEMETLLYFVALLASRVPAVRENIDGVFNEIAQRTLELTVATPERWEASQAQMRESGYTVNDQLPYEEARQVVENRSLRFSMSQNWQVGQMFHSADIIFPTLMGRKWCLLLSRSGSFICSDHPVTIVFTEPTHPFMSPGFGLKHTEVTVPLSKHVLLRGVWDIQPLHAVSLNRKFVSHYNTVRSLQADRFLFSAVECFPWMDGEQTVHTGLSGLSDTLRTQGSGPEL